MLKAVRLVQSYLVFALPLVITIMIWGTLQPEAEIAKASSAFVRGLWEVLAWNLIVWFSVLILFLVAMVFSPTIRESTLKRLANLNERDEREQFIVGKAARATYISTLGVMILLLFLSLFTVNVTRAPEDQAINGKRGTLTIGLNFQFFDTAKVETAPNGEVLFESNDLPLSKAALVLTIMLWQLAAFNLTARRESRA